MENEVLKGYLVESPSKKFNKWLLFPIFSILFAIIAIYFMLSYGLAEFNTMAIISAH